MLKRDKNILKASESLKDAVDDLTYSVQKLRKIITKIPEKDEDRGSRVEQFNSVLLNLRDFSEKNIINSMDANFRKYIT